MKYQNFPTFFSHQFFTKPKIVLFCLAMYSPLLFATTIKNSNIDQAQLQPYVTKFKGKISAIISLQGTAKLELEKLNQNTYRMSLFVKVPGMSAQDITNFTLEAGVIIPQSYSREVNILGSKKNEAIMFDWQNMRATNHKGQFIPLHKGQVDPLTAVLVIQSFLAQQPKNLLTEQWSIHTVNFEEGKMVTLYFADQFAQANQKQIIASIGEHNAEYKSSYWLLPQQMYRITKITIDNPDSKIIITEE